ncbi:peptidoglycan-binding protein [uncultured Brevundimonas sp.]|mgnify:CR=1 FL=1|uniref:peptidoglycan-binding protein n=1 Tax=uncultured Brevundimonas sp. TaxID=213418 RepID=UPI0030EE45CD|tara:strand:- start:212 stop:400 length:189 start_codon:yes stop_codon:yes gene_type:complete
MADSKINKARGLLQPATASHNPWATFIAAALAATAAVLMAGVVVLGPGVQFTDPAMLQDTVR